MAVTKYWLGTADGVAQVDTVQITAFDAATTYEITINDFVVSVIGNTSVNQTAIDLKDALEASLNPYFTQMTYTVTTDTITITADNAGAPFKATSSVSGGTGTIGAVTNTTASAGPNDWSTANNWSDSIVPVSTDTVIIRDNSINIAFGLAQSAVVLTELIIDKTYTGKIGLDYRVFATNAAASTTDATEEEYRTTYLEISATDLKIGQSFGSGTPIGSSRLLIDLGSNVSNVEIFDTANTSSETGRQAVRLKNVNASSEIFVRSAPGGVGLAAEIPDEVSTVSKISISDVTSATRVQLGAGVTITTFEQNGGDNLIEAAATITTITVNGGTLQTEGDYTVTTFNINDGVVNCNHIKTGGDEITTLNMNGGTINSSQSNIARTWATVNLKQGAILIIDPAVITITTLNEPTTDKYTLTVST